MTTQVAVNTYTYTATYVTTKLLLSLKEIVRETGLSPARLTREWDDLEEGISVWLESRHLRKVILEVFRDSDGKLATRWDLEIVYGYSGDGSLWTDTWALKHAIRKAGCDPSGCDYGILVRTAPGAPSVSGWSSTSLRSTDGFQRYYVGSTIGGPGLATETAYWGRA